MSDAVGIIVRNTARNDRMSHVTRDDRIVDVGCQLPDTSGTQEREAEAQARRVNDDVERRAPHGLGCENDRTQRLADQRRHRVSLRLDGPTEREPHKLNTLWDLDTKARY